jgi:hypothetical protein
MAEETEVNVLEGYGVRVYHGEDELVGVLEVEPPDGDMDDVETSHMGSPGRAKTYKPGWLEPGEMSVTMHFDPAIVGALYGLRAARTVEDWKVEFLDGSSFTSKGYVKTIGTPVEREGLTTVELTVKLSGVPTFAAGEGVGT